MALPDPQPAATPTLSPTESQTLAALRSFLLAVLPTGTEVVRGQDNRVPEPIGPNFVVMTPLTQPRLGTNEVTYFDDVFVASIVGTTMTVYAYTVESYLTDDDGQVATDDDGVPLTDDGPVLLILPLPLSAGMLVIDRTTLSVVLVSQISGVTGGPGTYEVGTSSEIAPEIAYAGVRADLTPVELTVQLDVHGPASGDNTRVVESLFRSEYAVDLLAASGLDLAPLYCTDPRQVPFFNDSNQVESRWSLDAHLQVNPIVRTPQQFATEVVVEIVETATEYTGPVV